MRRGQNSERESSQTRAAGDNFTEPLATSARHIDKQISRCSEFTAGREAVSLSSSVADTFTVSSAELKMVQFSSNDDPAESIAPSRLAPRDARGPVSAGSIRTFTCESANRVLPLVGRIAEDLLSTWRDLENEAAQIRGIHNLPHPTDIRIFTEELDCVKEAFRLQNERLHELQRELSDLGVVVDSLEDGAFDFPASHNCRPVRLCWQVGEPQVMHWHGINESFCHRRKLVEVPLDC